MTDGQFEILAILVDCVFAVALAYIAYKTHRFDMLEDRLQKVMETRVDEKFDDIKRRLKQGDEDFADLAKRDNEAELRFTRTVGDLKNWMLENFAKSTDLKVHERHVEEQHVKIRDSLSSVARDVAVLAGSRHHGGPHP